MIEEAKIEYETLQSKEEVK